MNFENFYYCSEEDKKYEDVLKKNKIIYFNLIPNMNTVKQLNFIDSDYIENNLDYFRLLIIPIYKYFWRNATFKIRVNKNKRLYVYLNYEIKGGEFIDFTDLDFEVINYSKEQKEFYIHIDDIAYTFSLEAYSFYTIRNNKIININDLDFYQIVGLVSAALRMGILSSGKNNDFLKFSNEFINPFDPNMKRFYDIKLKSLEPVNQIRFFDIWLEKKDCVITGSTGVGKTSQVPKIFFWFNYLFGGYDIKKIMHKSFHLDEDNDNRDKTMLIFPRKTLIKSNGENFLKSIGYYVKNECIIENSPVTMSFKDVKNTPFYNKQVPNAEFNICINRIAAASKLNNKNLSCVIVDEIHEHETFSDICITILKKRKKYINNIILMSATIDEDKDRIIQYFKNIEFIHIEGDKLFPVDEIYIGQNYIISDVIKQYKPDMGKSGIFFFSSINEIDKAKVFLEDQKLGEEYEFIEMHSKVEPGPNDRIKKIETNKNKRTIVLSTNILESSLTLTNAQYVYDTGKFFSKSFYGGKMEYITKSMAEQRKGRVGRRFKGKYVILYNRENIKDYYKKIDSNFLYPYIIFYKRYKIDFNDTFILPTDFSRFDKTIKYLKLMNINVDEDIVNIYNTYNKYKCDMIEYIPIYKKKEIALKLEKFEGLDNNDSKLDFILSNRDLYNEIENINFICKLKYRLKDVNYIIIKVQILNMLIDGLKEMIGRTTYYKSDYYFMISPNLFLPRY